MPMCYKDKTFCYSDCVRAECHRYFSEKERENSRKWWSHDPDNAPVAFSDFSDHCPSYLKPEHKEN